MGVVFSSLKKKIKKNQTNTGKVWANNEEDKVSNRRERKISHVISKPQCFFQFLQKQEVGCYTLAVGRYLGQPVEHRNEEADVRHAFVVQVTDSIHQLG